MSELWRPSIEVESNSGVREVALETRHFMNRRLFINGTIDSELANAFLSKFMYLEEVSFDPVYIYINSPGGEVSSGLMIYDIINDSKLPINIVCTGIAASMAAVILAGGQKGRRFIFRHGKVMIHEPLIADGVGGSATSIRNISESILKTRDVISEILSTHTGKPISEINAALGYDHYMDAEEAIEFGLCDNITNNIFIFERWNGR